MSCHVWTCLVISPSTWLHLALSSVLVDVHRALFATFQGTIKYHDCRPLFNRFLQQRICCILRRLKSTTTMALASNLQSNLQRTNTPRPTFISAVQSLLATAHLPWILPCQGSSRPHLVILSSLTKKEHLSARPATLTYLLT